MPVNKGVADEMAYDAGISYAKGLDALRHGYFDQARALFAASRTALDLARFEREKDPMDVAYLSVAITTEGVMAE